MNIVHKLRSRQYLRNCDTFPGTMFSARNFLYLFQFKGLNNIVFYFSVIMYEHITVIISKT